MYTLAQPSSLGIGQTGNIICDQTSRKGDEGTEYIPSGCGQISNAMSANVTEINFDIVTISLWSAWSMISNIIFWDV
jgi:hypothetical protein